jgi:hypothetical protein
MLLWNVFVDIVGEFVKMIILYGITKDYVKKILTDKY